MRLSAFIFYLWKWPLPTAGVRDTAHEEKWQNRSAENSPNDPPCTEQNAADVPKTSCSASGTLAK
jgi:hypothetical protein